MQLAPFWQSFEFVFKIREATEDLKITGHNFFSLRLRKIEAPVLAHLSFVKQSLSAKETQTENILYLVFSTI
jgi:hypothetical protein